MNKKKSALQMIYRENWTRFFFFALCGWNKLCIKVFINFFNFFLY